MWCTYNTSKCMQDSSNWNNIKNINYTNARIMKYNTRKKARFFTFKKVKKPVRFGASLFLDEPNLKNGVRLKNQFHGIKIKNKPTTCTTYRNNQ